MTTATDDFATFAERTLRGDPNAFVANLPSDVLTTLRDDDPDGVLYELVCQEMWPTFILWSRNNEEICARFTTATGMPLARNTGIEVMVDRVTGYRNAVMDRFVEWVTFEIYGIECAPAAYRAKMATRGRL
jgi:hypothetical protein